MTLKYMEPTQRRLSHTSLAPDRTPDQSREVRLPWRKWYRTARWRKLRAQVLLDAMYTCERCGTLEGDTSRLVADHKTPHRGREELFWDRNNLACICKSCHDGAKQREERATLVGVWD